MITQVEISNIGFSIKANIKKLLTAGVINQHTIATLLNKNPCTINLFIHAKHTAFRKKTILGFYDVKDRFYKICNESIKAKNIDSQYLDVLDSIMNELDKLDNKFYFPVDI